MKKLKRAAYVTRPFLPPLEEFQGYLRDIWKTRELTNNGKYHRRLEKTLCERLGVKHVSLFSNGTLALLTALRALKISGEVITTPFSFVATTHALWWNGIKPVFVDIEPGSFTLDPRKIGAAITPRTTAILPVHVYGNPCRLKELRGIASARGLRLVYDAAHAFGVGIQGKSIADFGDVSVLSFHATKVFNTFEGGAVVCRDGKIKETVDFMKNFGFADETTVVGPGINAKMNEFQAALGLAQLKYLDHAVEMRRRIVVAYRDGLRAIPGIRVLEDVEHVRHNYAYFPILIDGSKFGRSRDEVYERLKAFNIFARRYFFPLISQFPAYRDLPSARKGMMPVAEKAAREVLCLPLYPGLGKDEVAFIIKAIESLRA